MSEGAPPPVDDARSQIERLARSQGALAPSEEPTRRSALWVFWAIVTVLLVLAGLDDDAWLLLVAPFTGLYARYLYRGGKVRFFII